MRGHKIRPSSQFDAPLYTRALWMPACYHRSSKSALIFLMRSGERFDRVFGEQWQVTEVNSGKLYRTDANMPLEMRALEFSRLDNDSPITPYGSFTCTMVARALNNRRVSPHYIVCSPALRTVQSAAAVGEILNVGVQIDDELCEPMAWYKDDKPTYLTQDQLIDCGLPIILPNSDSNFIHSADTADICSLKRRRETFHNESETHALMRIERALRKHFAAPRDAPLLIVGHAITLAIALRIAHETQTKADNVDCARNATLRTARENIPPLIESGRNGSESSTAKKQMQHSSGGGLSLAPADHVELGIRFPYSCLISLARSKNDESSTRENATDLLVYELPDLIPSLTLSRTLSNEADFRV